MKISKNPLTQETHEIPKKLDDQISIEMFLSQNAGKKVVVVQGLGFVGAVMSLVCANAFTEEYAVIGVDLPNEVNIKLINPGFVETPATSVNNFKMPFLMTAEKAASIIFSRIYKKGFEISFPFPFNFIMKFGSILPYNIYFKFTDYISRK